MEGDIKDNVSRDLNFHSENLMATKAKEKREIFVNSKDKKKSSALRKPFPTKIVVIIGLILVAAGAISIYLHNNWWHIYRDNFAVTRERAESLMSTDTEKAIKIYDKVIKKETDDEEKALLYIRRSMQLRDIDEEKYRKLILSDAYEADKCYPSYTTALYIAGLERSYGSEETALEYEEKAEQLQGKILIMGEG